MGSRVRVPYAPLKALILYGIGAFLLLSITIILITCLRVKFTSKKQKLKKILWRFFGVEKYIGRYCFSLALSYWVFYFLSVRILLIFLTDTFLISDNPALFLHKKTDEYPVFVGVCVKYAFLMRFKFGKP